MSSNNPDSMIPSSVNLIFYKKTPRNSEKSINVNISSSENHDISKQSLKISQNKTDCNTKSIGMDNKDSIYFSTQGGTTFTNRNEFLDYTFRQIKTEIDGNDKNKITDYLSDLEQTYSINVDMLQNIICNKFKNKEKFDMLKVLDRIKLLKEKKKKMLEEKMKVRGKSLLDKQVLEEKKRIKEENDAINLEQEDEIRELVENKFCSIKELEKKFQEVDIYLKKHYPNVYSYEILKIVETNENYINKKTKLKNEINDKKQKVNGLLLENRALKKNESEKTIDKISTVKAEDKLDLMEKLFIGKIETLKLIKEKLINLKKNFGEENKRTITKKNDNINLSYIGKRAVSNINLNVSNLDMDGIKTPMKNAFFEQTMFFNDTTQFGNGLNKTNNNGDFGPKDQLWDLSIIKKESKDR